MKKTQSGLTLLELLITITIASILAAIAGPSFSALLKNNRLSADSNDLLADLALARSEAAKRGVRVTLCASNTGTSCSGANWADGRIVFVDRGTAGTVDAGDEILRVTSALRGPDRLLTAASFTNNNYVQYRPKGAADSTGTFTLCAGTSSRTITINTTGRAMLGTNGTCS
jgi:type IV fimbrial biogenesis protein FimT